MSKGKKQNDWRSSLSQIKIESQQKKTNREIKSAPTEIIISNGREKYDATNSQSKEHICAMMVRDLSSFNWGLHGTVLKDKHPYEAYLTLGRLSMHPDVKKKLMGTQGNAMEWRDRDPEDSQAISYLQIGNKRAFSDQIKAVVARASSVDNAEFKYLKSISEPPSATSLRGWEFLLSVDIKVERTLFSKDDHAFSPLENNVCREWAFHIPIYKASGFSGVFRNALWHRSKADPSITSDDMDRLMGQKGEDDGPQNHEMDGKAPQGMGWLHFYPLVFRKTEIDILTPLNSKTRFPDSGAIDMEGIASGETATISIGYFPLKPNVGKTVALKDIENVTRICKDLIDVLGVGAKRNSGYGTLSFYKWSLGLGGNYKVCLEDAKTSCAGIELGKINLITNGLGWEGSK